MKYLSLDLETTGVDPSTDQILQVSMIVEDTTVRCPVEELPHFTAFLKHKRISGNAFALGMNGWILDIISGRNKDSTYPVLAAKDQWELEHTGYCSTWIEPALEFLTEHFSNTKITVAGKNVAGFDIPFMPQVIRERFRHRTLDVGVLYVNFDTDTAVPDLASCKIRAGLLTPVAHDAREDAMDVICLVRAKL